MEAVCRSCADTGVDFLGKPCPCPSGQPLPRKESSGVRFAEVPDVEATASVAQGDVLSARDRAPTGFLRGDDARAGEADSASASAASSEASAAAAGGSLTFGAAGAAVPDLAGATEGAAGATSQRPGRLAALAARAQSLTAVADEAAKSGTAAGSLSSGGERSMRYTSGLLSLLLRAYAKRGRPPPALCACVPLPSGQPAPKLEDGGHLSQAPAWEAYVQRISCPTSHARNCEFSHNLSRLQRQVLVLIQEAKEA